MSVFQAAFIALFYTFARSSFNAGLGAYILSQPLVAGAIAGLLLGDPIAGAALGGVLNLATLALSNLRLRVGPDVALIGYVGVSVLLLAGIKADSTAAATIFAALAIIGIVINFMRGVVNSVLAHWADFFADRGNAAVVGYVNVIPTQVWLFLISFFPAFFLLRFDAKTLLEITATIPNWVQSALNLSQYLLAALGIALSLRLLIQGSSIAYFVLGWLGAQIFGLAPVTLLGASIAIIHAFLARKRMESSHDTLITDTLPSDQTLDPNPNAPRLTGNDLRLSLLLWVFFHDAGLNFELSQNMGFATAMAPIASRLYGDVQERAACLRRHLTLFTTEFSVGALLVGATAAMEERRAAGEAISDAEIVGAKTGLMAALGVSGEALVVGGITALGVAIGAALARQQTLLGPFLFVVFEAAAVLAIAYASFNLGYTAFRRLDAWARANDWLRAGLFGAVRLGTFMLGALVLSAVPVGLPAAAVIQIDAARIPLQAALLDGIMPRMIPLAVTLGLWWLLRYRNINPMVLLGALIFAAVAAAGLLRLLGWL
ncbi:MAG: PTS system mannose/fructose/sorbose family transporter subunit IID [Chloroflexi bacterium]|nr:PTS system mannose/fructose/sorbose family transporter subunit IID [Chloroflexota bacterium]MCL5274624.1 PTS system mannose/fructose/sorbose family transporter subunit IID [Chloroflexota bacterium]